jgi:murein DD-endopeptidase MepM/ murein hydrolase activator NlpD
MTNQARGLRIAVALSAGLLTALLTAGPTMQALAHVDPAGAYRQTARRQLLLAARLSATERRIREVTRSGARVGRDMRRAWRANGRTESPYFIDLSRQRHLLRDRLHRARRGAAGLRESLRAVRADVAHLRAQLSLRFPVCPVDGPRSFLDDFGVISRNGKDHVHQGIDIFAPYGTPVRAPFAGTAVAATNALGGYAVRVYGPGGFVYQAHLSGFGGLGPVRAGEVVGYGGTTGNARGGPPHDHFEWHPGGGLAVNPYPYLLQACAGGH